MMHKLTSEEMHRLTVNEFKASTKLPLVVVLDNVRSQNNIGSVFRTSDAFRVSHIALCGICSTPPHREIHKTALGAEESVEWSYYEDTVACVRELKKTGYRVYAVEQVEGSSLLGKAEMPRVTLAEPLAIVMGNEIEGVREDVLQMCDGCFEIPQEGTKHSLNISCAAAIVIWELYKTIGINK